MRVAGIRIELLFENVLGLELSVLVFQANFDAVGVEENTVGLDAGSLECTFDAFERLEIGLERRFGAGDLDSR